MKIICPECSENVGKQLCVGCGTEAFSDNGDTIYCLDLRGKHACSEDCYRDYLVSVFEDKHTVSESYTEEYSPEDE